MTTGVDSFYGLQVYGLDLILHSAQPLHRREHHGGWLRGVLGHALFRGNCIYQEPSCAGCALRSSCPYPQVFKPYLISGQQDRLPPYLIHNWRVLTEEPGIRCQLLLIGPAFLYAENWIRQLESYAGALDMGGSGTGRLGAIYDLTSSKLVFSAGRFRQGAILNPLHLPLLEKPTVTVRLLTPLVSKHDKADPLFSPLRTRLQRLVNTYGDGDSVVPTEPPWRIKASNLREVTIPQGTRRVRGLRGEITLTGLTAEGAQLLAAGYYLHAGAEATLGFGRYDWR